MASKSVPFEIFGRNFSLCYTVKASRLIDERYGGLDKMADALNTTPGKQLEEVMWILSTLLAGGYAHEKASAQFAGVEFHGEQPPDAEMLGDLYSLSDIPDIQTQIFSAINTGNEPEIMVKDTEKNAEATPGH